MSESLVEAMALGDGSWGGGDAGGILSAGEAVE